MSTAAIDISSEVPANTPQLQNEFSSPIVADSAPVPAQNSDRTHPIPSFGSDNTGQMTDPQTIISNNQPLPQGPSYIVTNPQDNLDLKTKTDKNTKKDDKKKKAIKYDHETVAKAKLLLQQKNMEKNKNGDVGCSRCCMITSLVFIAIFLGGAFYLYNDVGLDEMRYIPIFAVGCICLIMAIGIVATKNKIALYSLSIFALLAGITLIVVAIAFGYDNVKYIDKVMDNYLLLAPYTAMICAGLFCLLLAYNCYKFARNYRGPGENIDKLPTVTETPQNPVIYSGTGYTPSPQYPVIYSGSGYVPPIDGDIPSQPQPPQPDEIVPPIDTDVNTDESVVPSGPTPSENTDVPPESNQSPAKPPPRPRPRPQQNAQQRPRQPNLPTSNQQRPRQPTSNQAPRIRPKQIEQNKPAEAPKPAAKPRQMPSVAKGGAGIEGKKQQASAPRSRPPKQKA